MNYPILSEFYWYKFKKKVVTNSDDLQELNNIQRARLKQKK
jgi:hypothetical protein